MNFVRDSWVLRHLESEQASNSFVSCVRGGGGFHVMDRPWALIKEFMIMSDEHGLQLFRQASACEHGVVIRGGVIVPFFYFTKIFNSRAFTELDLSENQITDISALGNALHTNSTLRELYLDGNQITDITALGNALNTNSTLTELDLAYNEITSEGKEILRAAWKHERWSLTI